MTDRRAFRLSTRLTLTLAVALAAAGCGSAVAVGTSPAPSATASSASPTASASSTPDATAGWVAYTSTANHLTFGHPANLSPKECGWVWVDATTATSCPQGDGFCCVFFRSSDNGQTGSLSLISTNPALFPGGITRDPVTVDGVSGFRLSGTQTIGQGGGPQVEYDFTARGRNYNLFAYVGGQSDSLSASAPSASLFDQMVQTVTFTS